MTLRALTSEDLVRLVRTIFAPGPNDHKLAILVDLPTRTAKDNTNWRWRREAATDWWRLLNEAKDELGLNTVDLIVYQATGRDGANLPTTMWKVGSTHTPGRGITIGGDCRQISLRTVLCDYQLLITPTEFSTTQPLKRAVREDGCAFRAATMPGLPPEALDVLFLDWQEVDRRVQILTALLREAVEATVTFCVGRREHRLFLDLENAYPATASSGLLHKPGMVGNVPSGEAFIAPWDKENRRGKKRPSRTRGTLPHQIGDRVVLFQVRRNRIIGVLGKSRLAQERLNYFLEDSARGNIAELGLGVWCSFMKRPIPAALAENDLTAEKVGPHIGRGRNDGFGGRVGTSAFRRPANAEHVDWVYIHETQPLVQVVSIVFHTADRSCLEIVRNGDYVPGLFDVETQAAMVG